MIEDKRFAVPWDSGSVESAKIQIESRLSALRDQYPLLNEDGSLREQPSEVVKTKEDLHKVLDHLCSALVLMERFRVAQYRGDVVGG